jgi:hypothetical protein
MSKARVLALIGIFSSLAGGRRGTGRGEGCNTRQRPLKLRCKTSIGYESRKCTQDVQSVLPGVIRVLQSNIHIYYPTSLQLPT